MRNRAARLLFVVSLFAGASMAGAAVSHVGLRAAVHHLTQVAAVPTSAPASAALPHAHSRGAADTRAAVLDALLASAAILAISLLTRRRRERVTISHVEAIRCRGGCRAPPSNRL